MIGHRAVGDRLGGAAGHVAPCPPPVWVMLGHRRPGARARSPYRTAHGPRASSSPGRWPCRSRTSRSTRWSPSSCPRGRRRRRRCWRSPWSASLALFAVQSASQLRPDGRSSTRLRPVDLRRPVPRRRVHPARVRHLAAAGCRSARPTPLPRPRAVAVGSHRCRVRPRRIAARRSRPSRPKRVLHDHRPPPDAATRRRRSPPPATASPRRGRSTSSSPSTRTGAGARRPSPTQPRRLGVLAGTALTMPRSWFRDEWHAGRLSPDDLDAAAVAVGDPELAETALERAAGARSSRSQPTLQRLALGHRPARPGHRSGARAAPGPTSSCTRSASTAPPTSTSGRRRGRRTQSAGLFATWRSTRRSPTGSPGARGRVWAREPIWTRYPTTSTAAIAAMLDELRHRRSRARGVSHRAARLGERLGRMVRVPSMAGATRRRRRRRDRRTARDPARLGVAARRRRATTRTPNASGCASVGRHHGRSSTPSSPRRPTNSVSTGCCRPRSSARTRTRSSTALPTRDAADRAAPTVQAVFCIDVRSEVFRRALRVDVGLRAHAGLRRVLRPPDRVHAGRQRAHPSATARPARPVRCTVTETVARVRRRGLGRRHARRHWESTAVAGVPQRSVVGVQLRRVDGAARTASKLREGEHAAPARTPPKWEHEGSRRRHGALRPRLALVDDDPAAAAAIAHRVLTAMGLVDGFAPLVHAVRPRQPQREQPARGGPRLRRVRRPDRRGERTRARRPAQHLRRPTRAGRARRATCPTTTWFVACPARHDHRHRRTVRHRPRTRRHTASGSTQLARTARRRRAIGLGPNGPRALGLERRRGEIRHGSSSGSSSGRTTGRRFVPSGASPATPRSWSHPDGEPVTSISVAAASCTTTTGASIPTCRCSR